MGLAPGFSSSSDPNPSLLSSRNIYRNLLLAYQSFGVVYGGLSISPLYVFTSTFSGQLQNHQNEEAIFGAFSLIFWTLLLIPLLKYVIIVMNADDNGQGGPFALYSLLCRHGNFSLLPNHLSADEDISTYKYGRPSHGRTSSALKKVLERYKMLRIALLVFVLFGACMVIGDGVFTPAISVLSAVSGLQLIENKLSDGQLLLLACAILMGIFAMQHFGTRRVAVLFSPIVIIWLITIFFVGLYNILYWNPEIIRAISPYYIIQFFQATGYDGWVSLGGVILSITGSEALFAGLGHFTAVSIQIAFTFVVYPCLVVQYLGQAAFLSKHTDSIPHSFYDSIPDPVFWPVLLIATLTAIVGSLAVITATFSIISQCQALGCFPRVKVVHTSKDVHVFGQIYIPEINWMLMILTLAVTIGFKGIIGIGNAYGLACIMVMCATTFLTALVMLFVWQNTTLSMLFLLFFWSIEGVYLLASLTKVDEGGWVLLVSSLVLLVIMYTWHYGAQQKYNYDVENKVSLEYILSQGPTLGIDRVPGIGLIYSDLVTGIPAIFSHFIANLPACHEVLVFVCIKSVPVPFVSPEERILIGRICPSPFRMYRCVVRKGYKDLQGYARQGYDGDFEDQLIQSIAGFIEKEDEGQGQKQPSPFDGKMAVINSRTLQSCSSFVMSEVDDLLTQDPTRDIENPKTKMDGEDEDDDDGTRKRKVRFEVLEDTEMEDEMKEELVDLISAREVGVAYIMGHSYIKARLSSSFVKRFVINVGFTILGSISRRPAGVLNVPLANLIEVGMVCRI